MAGVGARVTYLQFHLVFTLPWLALLLGWAVLRVRSGRGLDAVSGRSSGYAVAVLLVHVAIALIYTTPWDNYLVARGVWGYPPGRVLFTLGYVPVEEYLFFVIQTGVTGLWLLFLLSRRSLPPPRTGVGGRLRVLGATLWLLVAAAGVLALARPTGTYLGLILAWAGPVLALQWGFGGDLLLRRPRVLLAAVSLPTLYLWAADRFAIGAGVWWIDDALTTGLSPLGLPVEEAVFFLVTNLLIVFGMSLALDPGARLRLERLRQTRPRWWQLLFGLWAVSMVPLPLFPGAFVPLVYGSTALLAAGVLGFALERFGRRAWALFAVAFVFGVVVEGIGYRSGLPFGSYHYTAPGPALLGVPLLVPLGWFAFSLVALSVAPLGRARLVAPLALVAWDLALDPLMVQQGFWRFDAGGIYEGIPLSNFAGWYLAGYLLVSLLIAIEPRLARGAMRDLRYVYLVEAFLVGIGLAFFGLLTAAVVAPLAMGLLLLATWARAPTPVKMRS